MSRWIAEDKCARSLNPMGECRAKELVGKFDYLVKIHLPLTIKSCGAGSVHDEQCRLMSIIAHLS